jgi:hypothetical protein
MVDLVQPFRKIAKNSRNYDVESIIENANEIYENLYEYGLFIEKHIDKYEERFFLRYP